VLFTIFTLLFIKQTVSVQLLHQQPLEAKCCSAVEVKSLVV